MFDAILRLYQTLLVALSFPYNIRCKFSFWVAFIDSFLACETPYGSVEVAELYALFLSICIFVCSQVVIHKSAIIVYIM